MLTLHGREFKRKSEHASSAKILRARAREHSSNFCEQFEQRPNFASTFKLDGTFDTPSLVTCQYTFSGRTRKEVEKVLSCVYRQRKGLVLVIG